MAVPAAAAPAAAAVVGAVVQGDGDWQGVPAGICTAGTVASPSSAGCTTRAPASEPRAGGRARPGAAQQGCPPPSALCPCSGSAPAQTHYGQDLGHPRCFPLSQNGAKGLPQPFWCSVLLPLHQEKELALLWAAPAGSALRAMPQAVLRGAGLSLTAMGTASACGTLSLGHPTLGAAGWVQLLRARCPG